MKTNRLALLVALALAASGCTMFSADGGLDAVNQLTRDRFGGTVRRDVQRPASEAEHDANAIRLGELLAKPLDGDAAVEIALLNNRGLQATLAELGIAEADLVQAGRLQNPRFSRLRASLREHGGREYKIEEAITANVFALITMPLATAVERRRFAAVQRQVALDVLALASDARKAYVNAVAAQEMVRYAHQVQQAASASAELARRMAAAGNFNKLQQARERGFFADATLTLAKAEQSSTSARERLIRVLGLWGTQVAFKLPERLPDLPANMSDLPDIEQQAFAQRIDVQAARLETEALAKNLGLTKVTRFINVLEFGPARVLEGERSSPYKRGYEIGFELPIFDWGTARVAKAEALYMQSVERAAHAAIEARSEIREAYRGYRTSYEVARHYRDEIVPLRKRIAEENLLRYNGMLIGVFELLADARAQISSVAAYIEALRDFWLAEEDLRQSRIGKPRPMPVARTPMNAAPEAAGGH